MKAILSILLVGFGSMAQAKDVTFYKWVTVRAKIDASLLALNPAWICLDLGEPVRGEIGVGDRTYAVSDKRGVLLYGLSPAQLESFRKKVGQEIEITGKFEPAPSDRYPRYIIFAVK
ncbi:MAG TPA: hypothetical protein VFO40_01555 [Chthoniobacterales bacterium]|nr:hypothetical protein [Chthoniobacterales bacterium]